MSQTIQATQTVTVTFQAIQNELVRAYADARTTAGISQRWINAIDRAWAFFQRSPIITFLPDGTLLYPSESDSTTVFQANGTCGCEAFQSGQPCKHRAAARILAIALESKANAN